MESPSRPPLPWEQKGAIGALGLLCLQEIHETLLICLGKNTLGLAHLNVFSPILLTLFLASGFGLLKQSRNAWWWTVLSLTGFALFHLAIYWNPVRSSLRPIPERIATLMEYEWLKPLGLSPFGVFWVLARGVLLLLVPTRLLLGELRKALKTS